MVCAAVTRKGGVGRGGWRIQTLPWYTDYIVTYLSNSPHLSIFENHNYVLLYNPSAVRVRGRIEKRLIDIPLIPIRSKEQRYPEKGIRRKGD